ncbi:transposase family protein [[Kitasatospora] papulosa]|uniref:transposase family protein n=1 Tax=[Kitasatospora] papulosa TaxID=1464011 RepID=UPI0037F34D4B
MGAGAKHRMVFVDRLLATLVHLRHGVTHDVLACWFGMDRSTVTRAIGEVRPLLAERGCTVSPGVRLRTLAEVVEHLGATGKTGIIDGTEIRVRRPAVGRKDRDRFISGKNKQNAVKAMVFTDADGRLLFCSRPDPEVARTSPTPASWGWSSSWPTVQRSRSLSMPATKGSEHGLADAS